MSEVDRLIEDIEAYCQQRSMAESTFGRFAVNDGKFVGRLRAGKGVTMRTMERVKAYMAQTPSAAKEKQAPGPDGAAKRGRSKAAPKEAAAPTNGAKGDGPFRFYDNRQSYLMFVNTCGEKPVVAERVGLELNQIVPHPPALRLFDAGVGDGSVLTRVMRDMHQRHPTIPFLIVGKEISLEDVRLSLDKLADRFFEHPATVVVITNMYYAEAPWLMPRSVTAAAALNWHEVSLTGDTAHEFDEQIQSLQPMLTQGWQVKSHPTSGNPLYVRPSVLVLYREDHRFVLDPIIPHPGHSMGQYDLIIASQPYRARMSAEFKVQKVLAPLSRSLAPGGRLLGIHAYGKDPGLEIIQKVWPGRELGQTSRHLLAKALKTELGSGERDIRFNTYADSRSLFRYDLHTMPGEINAGGGIGTSTLFAAWNAAAYVYQVEDQALEEALQTPSYLKSTEEVLQKYGGLWFNNESYVISRRRQ